MRKIIQYGEARLFVGLQEIKITRQNSSMAGNLTRREFHA
jgi:hypothetical protein